MKKIFRLLFLGFLTAVALSPSVVSAAEDQTVQESSSSVYSEIDKIAPLVEDTEIITLRNGESYDFTRLSMIFPKQVTAFSWVITPKNNGLYSFNLLSTYQNGEFGDLRPLFGPLFERDRGVSSTNRFSYPDPEDSRYSEITFGLRIKNYEAAPITFELKMDIYHY